MVDIRPETPEDEAQVRAVNEKAFGQPVEADLVDRLRVSCPEAISLRTAMMRSATAWVTKW